MAAIGVIVHIPDEGTMDLVAANPALWQEHRVVLFIDEAQNLNPGASPPEICWKQFSEAAPGRRWGCTSGACPTRRGCWGT